MTLAELRYRIHARLFDSKCEVSLCTPPGAGKDQCHIAFCDDEYWRVYAIDHSWFGRRFDEKFAAAIDHAAMRMEKDAFYEASFKLRAFAAEVLHHKGGPG